MAKFKSEVEAVARLTAAGYGMPDIYKLVLLSPAELLKNLGPEKFNELLSDLLK